MTMRKLWILTAVVAASMACGTGMRPAGKATQKMVVLGFDGMDPKLLQQYLDQGLMPNFKKLISQGTFSPLGTTTPPESPVSWASFATGVNPGKHNIYDFLIRDTANYAPDLGMVHSEPPKFLFDLIPVSRPKITSLRGGTSFWVTAGQAGVRSDLLTVPITFPPEDVPNGEMLSGLPTPDLHGTVGTYSYFATDVSRYEEGPTEMGGLLAHLAFDGNDAHAQLIGPPNPIAKAKIKAIYKKEHLSDDDRLELAKLKSTEYATLPLDVTWTRGSGSALVTLAGQKVPLKTGAWSSWIDVTFEINFFVRVHGMVQLYLINANNELQLYVSPANFDPNAPPVPISSPSGLSADLFKELGTYRTLGWAEATNPLREKRIDEKAFMDDLFRAFDDRARVILNRLARSDWDLLVGVIESTDRVQHMMFRLLDPTHPAYDKAEAAEFGDSIQRVYQRADEFVGQVMAGMPPGTTLMIVSDHGFHEWRKAVNLNTWLVQNGYMTIQGQQPDAKKLDDLFGGGEYFENVDWAHTRAYSMGLGQIYFNLRGREGKGIVSTGQEYVQLGDELVSKLTGTLIDPETHQHIVRHVYKRDDVYSGEYLANAPDLQLGFEDGYRVSWQTTLGGSPQGILYPNVDRWSGDHCGFDPEITQGVLLVNRPIAAGSPRIIDIAPTVLKFFGVPIPKGLDGKALY
jgi:predicted AlkP superfamily phosphohydrolase/phosphomutase